MAVSPVDVEQILGRIDRSSSESLLFSLVEELARLRESHRDLLARVTAMEIYQSLGDRVLTDASAVKIELPNSVVIDAAFSLSAESGFYGVEYDYMGTPYRWTGPNPAFFVELMVDRTKKLDLKLHYSQLFVQAPHAIVRCYVDGIEIEASTISKDGEWEISATLPERDSYGATIVTFVCPGVQSPAEAGMSSDQRKLGLAFRWLKLNVAEQKAAAVTLPEAALAETIAAPVDEPQADAPPVPAESKTASKSRRSDQVSAHLNA